MIKEKSVNTANKKVFGVERSVGAVVFRNSDKGRQYLLLHHAPPYNHWDFPKGHIEYGEKSEETLKREVREETGIFRLSFVPDWKETIKYFVGRKGEKRKLKFVVFFLTETKTKEIKLSSEHQGFVWLSFEDAMKKITYVNSQNVLLSANKFIVSRLQ